jgi:integrase
MASLINDGNGKWRVSWCEGKQRPTVRIRCSEREAGRFRGRVEDLLAARIGGGISPELATWAAKLPEATHADLARHGLLAPRVAVVIPTLGELITRYKAAASSRVKPQTMAAYAQGFKGLLVHFGKDRALDTINQTDAEEWQTSMGDTGLALATRAKRMGVAKSLFNAAVRWGVVPSSPFAGLRSGSQVNKGRMHYISPADTARLIHAAPSHGWRCIIALARFGGLRCPSELLDLRWTDIDWDRRSLLVRSPKTAHHADGAERVVPIVGELLAVLEAAFEAAPDGAVLVVDRSLSRGSNLRTELGRIVARAGLLTWPRAYQNLRSSRAVDWVQQRPPHEVAGWMGHSLGVSIQHYMQPLDANFRAAAGLPPVATPEAGGVAQNAAQQVPEVGGNDGKRPSDASTHRHAVPVVAANGRSLPIAGMGKRGFEPRTPRM